MNTPFRYDFVGSFLRPQKLKDARKNFEEGTISQEKLTAVEDECILELVAKIKELGYHVITDGEFRRSTWHLDFMWGFEGKPDGDCSKRSSFYWMRTVSKFHIRR